MTDDELQALIDLPSGKQIFDCGPDVGCGECKVCEYLDWLEWAQSVAPPGESEIQRNEEMERYLEKTYPQVYGTKTEPTF